MTTTNEWNSFFSVLHQQHRALTSRATGTSREKVLMHLREQFPDRREKDTVFRDRWYSVQKVRRVQRCPGQLSFWPEAA